MEPRDIIDRLYTLWAQTTHAETGVWRPVDGEERMVAETDDDHHWVAAGVSPQDMEWICAAHQAFPELVRRLHEALDEADRLDRERDEREQLIADLLKGDS